jgi:uncharacterized membrane protein
LSHFLAVAFPNAADAEDALAATASLRPEDAAIVVRTARGRIELHQTKEIAAGEGLVAGGAVGVVAGLLLGIPVGGALVGLVGGGGFGLRDTGLPDDRLRALGRELEPEHALLCVLVRDDGLDRAREALSPYGEVVEAELAPVDP